MPSAGFSEILMEEQSLTTAKPVSATAMIAYGAPSWPMGAMAVCVFIFLPTVYAEVTSISMTTLGLVFLLVRSWDMVSDPLIGWLSDRSRSQFGRRRPFVLLAWLPMSAALYVLCTPGPDTTPVFLLIWSLVFYTAGTALFMPYMAWGAELSLEYHERSRIFAWRHVFTAIGTLSAAAFLAAYDPGIGVSREVQALESVTKFGLALLPLTLLFLFIKVRDPVPSASARARLDWASGFAIIRSNRAFRILLGGYFLNGVANALPATLFFLYVDHILKIDAKASGLLLYFGMAILGTPVWLAASRVWGKHRTWCGAMLVSSIAFLTALSIGVGDVAIFYVAVGALGFSLGADLILPGSMLADVVDMERADSGRRRTGIYFAIWAMVAKLALALAVGISFPMLSFFGFTATGQNDAQGRAALVAFFVLVPLIFKLAAAVVLWRYPLTAERHAALRLRIQETSGEGTPGEETSG